MIPLDAAAAGEYDDNELQVDAAFLAQMVVT